MNWAAAFASFAGTLAAGGLFTAIATAIYQRRIEHLRADLNEKAMQQSEAIRRRSDALTQLAREVTIFSFCDVDLSDPP